IGPLMKLAPQDFPRLDQIGIDPRVMGWTALVTLLTGIICGLAPAWQSARVSLNDALKEGGRGATEGAGARRGRGALVIIELTMAVILLVGAGLLLRSLWRLQRVDLGVNPERTLAAFVKLSPRRYNQPRQFLTFYERVLERARAIPGARAVAFSNS